MSTNEPYYPEKSELEALGFFEGYGELWVCPGTDGAQALIDFDEFGTVGTIIVNQRVTYEADMNSLTQIEELVKSANAPF